MLIFTFKFTDDARADVKALEKNVKNALRKKLTNVVSRDPVGCSEELNGELAGFRSFHWGDYRIVYKVFDDLAAISVVAVKKKDHISKESFYKKLETIAKKGELADHILRVMKNISPP